jgi:hypothetical protein
LCPRMVRLKNEHEKKAHNHDRRDLQKYILLHFYPPVVPKLDQRKTRASELFQIGLDWGGFRLLRLEKKRELESH